MTFQLMQCCQVGPLLGDLVAPYVWNKQRHLHLSTTIRSLILIVIINFFHSIIYTKGTKIHSRKGLLRPHPLLHVCLILICGIELHTYHFPMSYKKKNKKFLVMDVVEIYNRKELELKDICRVKLFKPKAAYALTKSQIVTICKWVKELKLSYGYASNLSRCVDINQGKLHGMKSHNCHVFMQQLLPIAFDSLLKHIWKPLVELSHFFTELTSTILNVEKLRVMENNISVLLCKLEQIFLLSFFDSMEYLPIRIKLVIIYIPLYYICQRLLPDNVHSYSLLVEETSTFSSFYIRRTKMPRNVDVGEGFSSTPPISVFNYPRKVGGKSITYFLDQVDIEAAHLYVLLNCEEVLNSENNIQDSLFLNLAWGPKRKVESWPIYIINGYKCHTNF
ncbi:hypothetical protein CR513_45026, partial [Mucuna pruriens]